MFSLRNWLEEATAQVNPFDKGRTAVTVRQARSAPPPAQTINRPIPPKQSFFNKVRDQFDANTEADQFRREQSGRLRDYASSQRAVGRGAYTNPIESVTRNAIIDPTVRAANTVVVGAGKVGRGLYDIADLGRVSTFGSDQDYLRKRNEITSRINTGGFGKTGGLLNLGTNIYNTQDLNDPKKFAGAVLETGADLASIVPIAKGASLGVRGTRLVSRPVLANAVGGIAENTASSIGSQIRETGKVQLAPTLLAGGLGGALPIGSAAAGRAVRGSIQTGRAVNTALDNTIPAVRVPLEQRRILSDYADMKLKRYNPDVPTVNKLHGDARAVAKRLGLDITSGSPMEVNLRIGEALEMLDNRVRGIKQGGYAKIPGTLARDATPAQRTLINDYAEMLEEMDKGARGGDLIEDGSGGYKRTSEHSQFYRKKFGETGRAPTKEDWFKEAKLQLEEGSAGYGASDKYAVLGSPLVPSKPTGKPIQVKGQQSINEVLSPDVVGAPSAPQLPRLRGADRKADFESLISTKPSDVPTPIKVATRGGESAVPISKLTQKGDTITSTNVNPNIKRGEKRFIMDDNGELIPDTAGAYRIFTDDEGRVTQFRIGDKVFNPKDLGDLSDVNDYGSSLATMRRNIERGFGKETGEKVNKFLVDHQQSQATKMIERQVALKEGMKAVADDLGISFGVGGKRARKISAAIQNFGEGKIKKADLISEFGDVRANKIVNADKWFRSQYDSLLDEMNGVLQAYGYDPVPKRKNYYTHFQEPSLWKSFGLKMNEIRNLGSPTLQDASPTPTRGKISNQLAGQSEFTLPNKRFNPYALQRKGAEATPDAFQAFERYINPTLNNIYMTPSITRARVLTKAIAQDADAMGKDANKIIIQTKEWANRLAGKSNRIDRPLVDSKGGQMYLKAANWAQRKAGSNTIVGNLSTAVMQPIVLGQTAGKFGYKNTILATLQEMSSAHAKNAPIRQSQFMRRRYADLTAVTATKTDRAKNIANVPLKTVEETAARITWNAAHNDAVSRGIKGADAIRYADIQAEKTLSGRSIGERPELFESKAAGPITMYQLEVNNFWQQFGKEMTKSQAAKTLVAAYGLNMLLQQATGRQVGFNPVDAVIDSYRETQKEEKSGKDKAISVGQRLAGELVDNAPFVGPIANATIGDKKLRNILGPTSNVGRFGVSSPLSALLSTTKIGNVPVPQNVILPFGGSQVKKTIEGLQGYLQGRLTNKNDETTVDIPKTSANALRGMLFGANAIPEVNQYYDNLGRKKVDQKRVPNQIYSKAGSMGLQGLTSDQQEMMRDAPPWERDKWFAMFQEKNQAKRLKDSGESAASTTSSLTSIKASTQKRTKDLKKTLSPDDWEIYNMSKAERRQVVAAGIKTENDMKGLDSYVDSQKKKLGYTTTSTKNTYKNQYNSLLSDFNDPNNNWSEVQKATKAKELKRLSIKKDYDDDVVKLYNMPKADMYAFIKKSPKGKALAEKLLEYDKKMFESGLMKYSKYRNGLAPASGGRRSSGGRKTKKGKFDYKLYGLISDPISTSKSLRQLLKEATV